MSDYADYLATYASVAAIIGVGVLLAAGMLGVNRLFRPTLTTPAKLLTYESGVDPVGAAEGAGDLPALAGGRQLGARQHPLPDAPLDAAQQPLTYIPLAMVAKITREVGANEIASENGRLRSYVQANVQDRDLGGFVNDIEPREDIVKFFNTISE